MFQLPINLSTHDELLNDWSDSSDSGVSGKMLKHIYCDYRVAKSQKMYTCPRTSGFKKTLRKRCEEFW